MNFAKSTKNAERKIYSKKTKRLIFYILVMALPILQFCLFYLYVNFNSILLAFQRYTLPTEAGQLGYQVNFAGLDNFKAAFSYFSGSGYMVGNSMKMLACDLLISLPLAVIFSFYIYKRYFGHKFFKVILFMPQIISSIIFVMLYKYIVNDVYKEVFNVDIGLLSKASPLNTRMATVLFYNVWISFGVNVMMFTGAMSNVDESLVESAHLDGANLFQEFWYITLPLIWSTFTTFVVIGFTGMFTHQLNLFAFFSDGAADLSSVGYFLYVSSLNTEGLFESPLMKGLTYPQLAALGLILTLFTLPVVLACRKLMGKFGPSVE